MTNFVFVCVGVGGTATPCRIRCVLGGACDPLALVCMYDDATYNTVEAHSCVGIVTKFTDEQYLLVSSCQRPSGRNVLQLIE